MFSRSLRRKSLAWDGHSNAWYRLQAYSHLNWRILLGSETPITWHVFFLFAHLVWHRSLQSEQELSASGSSGLAHTTHFRLMCSCHTIVLYVNVTYLTPILASALSAAALTSLFGAGFAGENKRGKWQVVMHSDAFNCCNDLQYVACKHQKQKTARWRQLKLLKVRAVEGWWHILTY